jgi:hypothetical protein
MGACVSCDHSNNPASPAIEHLRIVLRQHDEGGAAVVLNRHKGEQNATTNPSKAADDVGSATPEPRITVREINDRIYPAGISSTTSSTTSSTSWETTSSSTCIWSDDELRESLRRDSRYIYTKPMARTQVYFPDAQQAGSGTFSSVSDGVACFSSSGDTLCAELEGQGDSIEYKFAVPIDVPT